MIRVLLIEDSQADAQKIKSALIRSDCDAFLEPFEFLAVHSLGSALETLKLELIDVILLDLGLPDSRDFDGLDRLKKSKPMIPIIVLTSQEEQTLVALAAVKRGAQDYFSKNQLGDIYSLDRTIRYAIERKKREEELITAREDALRASKAKSEFLSNMSHDIRTPLNCIIGMAELLAGTNPSEESLNYIRMLTKASDSLLSLINNILDLSQIESGQICINKRSFDLWETIERVLDIGSARAHAKNLELIFKMDPDIPRHLLGDSEKLTQVLVNLIANAVKFTKAGEVIVAVTTLKLEANQTVVQFSVQDSGVGIAEDKFEVIFEGFTQLDQTDPAMKRQGSGLGLSICKRLIGLMGGNISLKSVLGEGSTFTVDLPFSLEPNIAKTDFALDLLGLEILVAEDNKAHALILTDLLRGWGASVHVCHSADRAIEAAESMRAKQKKFDLALLDLRMPGIAAGGLELAIHLKDDIEAVIMMLPTNHRHGDFERLKNAGITQHFFKPTKPEKLAEVVASALKKDKQALQTKLSKTVKSSETKSLSLLVADDSEDNRYLIEAFCRGTGYRLEMAEDGQQALEKFKEGKFDLVLMDIQMPQMNGYEALSAIRAWERDNRDEQVPILALTAFALKEEAEKCLRAGFGTHVTKPIRKDELIRTIKKYAA